MDADLDSFRSVMLTWAHRMANDLGFAVPELNRLSTRLALSDSDRERFSEVVDSVQNALQALDEIKALQNIPTIRVSSFNIETVIARAIRSTARISPRIKLTVRHQHRLPSSQGDPDLLVEIIRNLLDNAVQAIVDQPQPEIVVTSELQTERILIYISDNGIGVPQEIAADLFRKPISKSSRPGMGLYLSSQLVRTWGGDLSLISAEPGKTTFRISLPRAGLRMRVSGKKALVVDDEKRWSDLLSEILSERGFAVSAARSLSAARELILTNTYDLALLDLNLAAGHSDDLGGIKLAKIIKETSPQTSVIVLSAYGSAAHLREALRQGVDYFLQKAEFSPELLYNTLETVTLKAEKNKEALRRTEWQRYVYELLAIFSHELREPLVIIRRNAEALEGGALGSLTAKQRKALKSIHAAAQRESILLNAHLDLNRIETGAERLTYQVHDFVALIRGEINVHRPEARARGIKISTRIPRRSVLVSFDANRLRTALNPLVENAIKFSGDGARIVISAVVGEDFVEMSIEDEGPGMKPSEIDALLSWQPEQRDEPSPRIRSSGLGLSMAKRIIDLHGGRLWITSDGKKGTTVKFRLPTKT